MIYELYDWETANLIYADDTEAEALASVVRYVRAYGRESVMTWTLLVSTPDRMHKENVAAGPQRLMCRERCMSEGGERQWR